jgi:hypothetical protein
VVDDVLTFLRKLVNKDGTVEFTGDEVYQKLSAKLRQLQIDGANLYICCSDVQELMPVAKFQEQGRRDTENKLQPFPDESVVCSSGILLPGNAVATRFNIHQLLSSRAQVREKLFKFLEDAYT